MILASDRVVGILQPGYLPWLGYFEQLARADVFVHYDDVQFDKGGWRNRNRIKTAQGPQFLTVPVLTKGLNFPLIRDVRINNAENWKKKHISAMTQNYGKTPFFEDYAPDIFKIILKDHIFLMDLDLELINCFADFLDIRTPTVLASELAVTGSKTDRLIHMVKTLGGTVFYEGAAGRNYLDERFFSDASIKLVFQDYVHPLYPQQYKDFIPYLSIVDLLFNCGKESGKIFRRV